MIQILCRNCMGPAVPSYDGSIVCPYCGTRDQLPADQLARALELKRRLAAAHRSVVNLEGMDGALVELFERRATYWRVAWVYVAAAIIMVAMTITNAWPRIVAAETSHRLGVIVQAVIGSLWMIGFAIALAVAVAVGRRRYRTRVRPHLLARSPRLPGLPARCRACNGELPCGPDARGAFVQCEYCTTRSLVTPEIQAHQQVLLDDERAFHQSRANEAVGGMRGVSRANSRVFGACLVLTYAAIVALQALAHG